MKLFETNDEAVNWTNDEPRSTSEAYVWALKRAASAYNAAIVYRHKFNPYEKLLVNSWNGEFKVPITHSMKVEHSWYGVAKSTPNGDTIWNAVKPIADRINKASKAYGKYTRLAAKLKKTYRVETFNELKYKTASKEEASLNVPRRVYYSKDNYFGNPYWIREDVLHRYAGPVGHFPHWKEAEKTKLVELERTLKRNGIPGMTKMEGVVIKNHKWTDNKFVAYGANGRLIWKHMTGGNVIYIDGKKVSITDLTDTSNVKRLARQQEILEPLKAAA